MVRCKRSVYMTVVPPIGDSSKCEDLIKLVNYRRWRLGKLKHRRALIACNFLVTRYIHYWPSVRSRWLNIGWVLFCIFSKTSGRSRPSDKGGTKGGGAWYQKKFSQPFAPQFGLKKRGGPPSHPRAPPLDPPLKTQLKEWGQYTTYWSEQAWLIKGKNSFLQDRSGKSWASKMDPSCLLG